jgi:hypothetical protein
LLAGAAAEVDLAPDHVETDPLAVPSSLDVSGDPFAPRPGVAAALRRTPRHRVRLKPGYRATVAEALADSSGSGPQVNAVGPRREYGRRRVANDERVIRGTLCV